MAENHFPVLSPLAAQRQQAMLPDLLAAVRGRRQRRQARRAAVLAAALLAIAWLLWPRPALAPRATDAPVAPVAQAPSWSSFGDDPSVLARCAVAPAVRAEWFVDDATLHDLLATDARPAGVVRIGSEVRVGAEAIDPWGSELPAADQAPDGGTGS